MDNIKIISYWMKIFKVNVSIARILLFLNMIVGYWMNVIEDIGENGTFN